MHGDVRVTRHLKIGLLAFAVLVALAVIALWLGSPAAPALRVCPKTSSGVAELSQDEADRGEAQEGERCD